MANPSDCEPIAAEGDWRYVHIVPLFGRQHVPSIDCWCQPETDARVVTHRTPEEAVVL